MMKLPLLPDWVLIFLPKEWQEIQIQKTWDRRTDAEIVHAHIDSDKWIQLSRGKYFQTKTIMKIADDCRMRIDNYIQPQIDKRGISI